MSRSNHDQGFKNERRKYCSIWSTKIYRWLLFIGAMSLENFANRLQPRDAVFTNFHRRYNVTRTAILHNNRYLPPPIAPDFFLPEVIDNRARHVITNETKSYPNILYLPERDSSQALEHKGVQDMRYPRNNKPQIFQHDRPPVFPQGKYFQRTTQLSPSLFHPPVEAPVSSFVNRISVEEMSCQNAGDELFFRASIRIPKNSAPPVVDSTTGDTCQAIAMDDSYRINFEKDQVWYCGVIDCSTDGNQSYCLDLRFPVISGLRLRDDYRITLRCRIQDRIAHHTKRINVKTLETKARNIPNVLNGGFTNTLDVDVGLFKKTYSSENIFDTRILSGGTVILGEEILLRVSVNGDDGWRYSKISQVTVHYVEMGQRQNVLNSLWILDKDGCVNMDVREICPREQYLASSLESYLIFQAFMFEGMKETDEIFLTVKATACFEATDCILDCPAGHVRRAKRNIPDRNNTIEWQNDIALRVVLSKYELRDTLRNYYLAILLPVIALFALIALFWFIKTSFHRRTTKF